MKKQLLLRAPLLSQSGYGVHSRQVFRYLLSRGDIEVHTVTVPWGVTPWNVNLDSEGGLVGEVIKRTAPDGNKKYDYSVNC